MMADPTMDDASLPQRRVIELFDHRIEYWHRPDTDDLAICDEVLASYRMPWLLTTLRQRSAGGTRPLRIVDVGAHIGTFTLLAATCLPSAHVEAYEMLPANVDLLQRNVSANGLTHRVHVRLAVVADVAGQWLGKGYRYGDDGNTGGASVAELDFDDADDTPGAVPVIASGQLLGSGQIDLLKLDCEGCEFRIVFGAGDALANVAMLVGELHAAQFSHRSTRGMAWQRDELIECLSRHHRVTTWDRRAMPWGHSEQFLAVRR